MRPTLVLDTCAFLDLIAERWTEPSVIETFKVTAHPVILSVSVWEIARKLRLGKLTLPCDPDDLLGFVREVCDYYAITIISLSDRICHEAERFPLHHRDPFDRMILALSQHASCPVVSTDSVFEAYSVDLLRHRK